MKPCLSSADYSVNPEAGGVYSVQMTGSSLQRFKDAQNQAHAGYAAALAEIRAGQKRSHWIWYVFPQLAGLGLSHMSHVYGIADVQEAVAYLRDPVLRERLLSIAGAARDRVKEGVPVETLMDAIIDAQKLVSSLTLFAAVARKLHAEEGLAEYGAIEEVAEEILAAAASEGYPRCSFTLERLKRSGF
jgi:uncharacterized protein (DUF1810 family)